MAKENTTDKERLPIAEVIWEDAWVQTEGSPAKEAMRLDRVLRSTLGYKVGDTDECLILATDLYSKDQNTFNTPIVIPWDMVIGCWEFEVH
tara:strand:+ start:220 stop:492 length:273 start_codon:yes stop_codon:yes gene_type:complete